MAAVGLSRPFDTAVAPATTPFRNRATVRRGAASAVELAEQPQGEGAPGLRQHAMEATGIWRRWARGRGRSVGTARGARWVVGMVVGP